MREPCRSPALRWATSISNTPATAASACFLSMPCRSPNSAERCFVVTVGAAGFAAAWPTGLASATGFALGAPDFAGAAFAAAFLGGFDATLAAAFVVVLTAMAVAAPVCSIGADGITLGHAAQGNCRGAASI